MTTPSTRTSTPSTQPTSMAETLQSSVPFGLGANGPHVVALQTALKQLGFFPGKTNLNFGPITQASLIQFQLSRGIIVSKEQKGAGWFGPNTKRGLLAALDTSVPQSSPQAPAITRVAKTTSAAVRAVNPIAPPADETTKKGVDAQQQHIQQYIDYLSQIDTTWQGLFRDLHETLSQETYIEFCDQDMAPCITVDLQKLSRFSKNGFLPTQFSFIKRAFELYGKKYDTQTLESLTSDLQAITKTFTKDIWLQFQDIFAGTYITSRQATLSELAQKINFVLAYTIGKGYKVKPSHDPNNIVDISGEHIAMVDLVPKTLSNGLNSGFAFEAPDDTASELLPPKIQVS